MELLHVCSNVRGRNLGFLNKIRYILQYILLFKFTVSLCLNTVQSMAVCFIRVIDKYMINIS